MGMRVVPRVARALQQPNVLFVFLMHLLAVTTPLLMRARMRDVLLLLLTYNARMFGITAGYHRLLAHRSFHATRPLRIVLAVLGASSLQKGPLWWAAHHRHHHRNADTAHDTHSPVQHGFLWSHIGWFLLSEEADDGTTDKYVPDLRIVPELRLLERVHALPAACLALLCVLVGGLPSFFYGFVMSTVILWHGTFLVNSLAHMQGERVSACEFHGPCDARNNIFIALLTLGEGWHNNHHADMRSAMHGFRRWYQLDVTFLGLALLRMLGLVRKMQLPEYDDTCVPSQYGAKTAASH